MQNLIIILLFAFLQSGCKSSDKTPIVDPADPKEQRAGEINAELEASLNAILLESEKTSTTALCPEDVLEQIGDAANPFVECGAIRVPEFHDTPNGKFVALAFLKISKDNNRRPLLIIEQGGPGGSSMILAAANARRIPALLENFNILAVEQRGTSWTRPKVTCDETINYLLENINSDETYAGIVEIQKRCLMEVARLVSMDSISTYQIASDINYAAKTFGYQNYSYYGVSYGTIVGQYLLKYYPTSLHRTILDSPVVPGYDWTNDALRNIDFLIKKNTETFMAEVREQGTWGRNYEETLEYFKQLPLVFDGAPLQVLFTYKNVTYPVLVNKDIYRSLFLKTLITGQKRSQDEERSKTILTRFVNSYMDVEDAASDIMYQALICREFDVRTNQARSIVSQSIELRKLVSEHEFNQFLSDFNEDKCYLKFLPSTEPKLIKGAVATNESVLVVGGEIDYVTSPNYVALVAQNFINGNQAVFLGVSHGVLAEKECINESLINYLIGLDGRFTNSCE